MPALQTSYTDAPAVAFAGMRANQEPHTVISRVVTSPTLAFGAVACQGTNDNEVTVASASAFRGVAVLDVTVPALVSTGQPDAFSQGDNASIMTKGVIWVTVSGTVTAGAPAFFDPANGHISADNTKTAIPNAVFDSSASAGAIAKLRLA